MAALFKDGRPHVPDEVLVRTGTCVSDKYSTLHTLYTDYQHGGIDTRTWNRHRLHQHWGTTNQRP